MYNVNYMHTRITMSPYFAKARPMMVKHLSSYYYYYSCLERLQPHCNEIYPDKLLNYLQNISTQCSGYLKSLFSNATTTYGTKQLLPGRDRA